jgi:hypothetical protein
MFNGLSWESDLEKIKKTTQETLGEFLQSQKSQNDDATVRRELRL